MCMLFSRWWAINISNVSNIKAVSTVGVSCLLLFNRVNRSIQTNIVHYNQPQIFLIVHTINCQEFLFTFCNNTGYIFMQFFFMFLRDQAFPSPNCKNQLYINLFTPLNSSLFLLPAEKKEFILRGENVFAIITGHS